MIKLIKKYIFKFILYINRTKFIIKCRLKNVDIGSSPTINGDIMIRNKGEISIGNNVSIISSIYSNPVGGHNKTMFFVKPYAKLEIQDGCGISNCTIVAYKSVKIEKDVMIGGGCQIMDTDFHSLVYEERILKNDRVGVRSDSVRICEGVFIGTNCIILKGVTIGSKSIVGAGSVVTKNIPEGELWAGNPAKFIKKI